MLLFETVVESDSIHLPAGRNLDGKNVEVIIIESEPDKRKKYKTFFELAGKIDIDADAVRNLRKISTL